MKHDFLLKEYELNFEQYRYNDSRRWEIFKYLVTLASSAAVAIFVIYKYFHGTTEIFYWCLLSLCLIIYFASLLFNSLILQARLDCVTAMRQLNAIRGYLLEKEVPDFKNNQLYTSTDFPAVKFSNIHTTQLIETALISALFLTAAICSLTYIKNQTPVGLGWIIFAFIIARIGQILLSYKYLKDHGNSKSEGVVHGYIDAQ